MRREDNPRQAVREPAVAGQFYPASPPELERELKRFLSAVPPQEIPGKIAGLISPHAGYAYSGGVAAFGYKTLEGKGFKRAIVLAPSHRVGFRGAALPAYDAYKTPLGTIPIDKEICRQLARNDLYAILPQAHEGEHSLEVQLPFLQETLGEFSLIPIIIASSDFTHYGYSFGYVPFRDNIKENLKKLDLGAVDKIEKMDAEGFSAYVARTGATICGRCAIGVLLDALPLNARGKLLKYETSGDLTGDWSHCVSYVSMVFTVK